MRLALLGLCVVLAGPVFWACSDGEAVNVESRPVVGINADLSEKAGDPGTLSLSAEYVDAVRQAGGMPIVLPSLSDCSPADVEQQARMCDAFVFVGGRDVDPSRYGQAPHPLTNVMAPRREAHDMTLIRAVVQSGKPFLAICLGCQEVNVALGGTLVQDINDETSGSVRHGTKQQAEPIRHEVTIEPGTLLADIVGTTTLCTNSSHHQSILDPAQCLRVSARADDGVIECLEVRDHRFGLAVQWHPERLTSEPLHLRLFERLVGAARNRTSRSR